MKCISGIMQLSILLLVLPLFFYEMNFHKIPNPEELVCDSERLIYDGHFLSTLHGNIFTDCKQLKSLYLTKNHINIIDNYALKNLVNLNEIDLSSNVITILPIDMFSYTQKLEKVNLSKNNLTSLQTNLFTNLPYLSSVNFQYNYIIYVEKNCFVNVPSLKAINLGNNNLKTLKFNIIDNIDNLKAIYLGGNEWNCDLNLCEFMHTVVTRFWQEPFVPYCYSPQQLAGATFKEVIETPLPTVMSNVRDDPETDLVVLKCQTCSKTSLSWQFGSSTELTNKADQIFGKYNTESTLKIYDFSISNVGNYTCYAGSCATCESSTWIYIKIDSFQSNNSLEYSIGNKVVLIVLICIVIPVSICCKMLRNAILAKQNRRVSQSILINSLLTSEEDAAYK